VITWDEIKRQSNIAKHKIDFAVSLKISSRTRW